MATKCPAAGYLREALEIADRIMGTPLDYAVEAPLKYPSKAEMDRAAVLCALASGCIALVEAKISHDPRMGQLYDMCVRLCGILDSMPAPVAPVAPAAG